MFGLKRKKSSRALEDYPPVDPAALLRQQSVGRAIIGALVAIVVCNYLWIMTADLFGKIFPWLSMVQGVFIGMLVRRGGQGFDWRFPVIAATAAWLGAISANFVIAMLTTSAELGVRVTEVATNLTSMTFGIFFTETFNIVDHIYALTAAALAAFFSRRILNRREVLELRNYRQDFVEEARRDE